MRQIHTNDNKTRISIHRFDNEIIGPDGCQLLYRTEVFSMQKQIKIITTTTTTKNTFIILERLSLLGELKKTKKIMKKDSVPF